MDCGGLHCASCSSTATLFGLPFKQALGVGAAVGTTAVVLGIIVMTVVIRRRRRQRGPVVVDDRDIAVRPWGYNGHGTPKSGGSSRKSVGSSRSTRSQQRGQRSTTPSGGGTRSPRAQTVNVVTSSRTRQNESTRHVSKWLGSSAVVPKSSPLRGRRGELS